MTTMGSELTLLEICSIRLGKSQANLNSSSENVTIVWEPSCKWRPVVESESGPILRQRQ